MGRYTGSRCGKDKNNDGEGRKGGAVHGLMTLIFSTVIVLCLLALGVRAFHGYREEQRQESLRALAKERERAEAERLAAAKASSDSGTGGNKIGEAGDGADGQDSSADLYVSPIDFEKLRAVNPDTIAWVSIPGTDIDYPVVQTGDNELYLATGFDRAPSKSGAIYADCDCDADLMGKHNILYGHHMKNQTMFAQLVRFKEEEFFKEHRTVILYTPERELRLKTIAAVYGDADGEKRRTVFASEEAFRRYTEQMTQGCSFRDLPEQGVERLYSFVTCSYEFENARTILYAAEEDGHRK